MNSMMIIDVLRGPYIIKLVLSILNRKTNLILVALECKISVFCFHREQPLGPLALVVLNPLKNTIYV